MPGGGGITATNWLYNVALKTGAVIAYGTDAPVEDINPIASYYASVSSRTKDGSVFFPDQRMSRMEALRSYTINVAFAEFDHAVALGAGRGQQIGRAHAGVDAHRVHGEVLVLRGGCVVRGAAMVADHAQHRSAVRVVAVERPDLARDLGRGGVGAGVHDRGEGGALGPAFRRIVRDAGRHEDRPQVGIA